MQLSSLKIEFYNQKHSDREGSRKDYQLDHKLLIGDIKTVHTEGDIEVDPKMTVSELEKLFEDIYGLHIQVFRKSGDVYPQTTVTDDWTLEKQNEHGLMNPLHSYTRQLILPEWHVDYSDIVALARLINLQIEHGIDSLYAPNIHPHIKSMPRNLFEKAISRLLITSSNRS